MPKPQTHVFLSLSFVLLFFSFESLWTLLGMAPPPAPPSSGAGTQIEVSVTSSSDDAEESGAGTFDGTSTDLELVEESTTQKVGLRFQSVNIPKGAKVVAAYIEFTADETHSGATSLIISAQDTDDAVTFSSSNKISTRTKTTAWVNWIPSEVWSIGSKYKTANFATVVQEIVDRSGWNTGNNLAIIIEGSGKRVAESFDKSGGVPPKLVVVYDDITPAANKTFTYVQGDNNADFFSYDPDPSCNGGDWENDWTKFGSPDGFYIDEYDNGSIICYGTIVDKSDNNNRWDVYMRLENKRNWTEWDALGRMFYESSGGGNCSADHINWDYYEIDSTVSRIIGTAGYANEGKVSKIRHNPPDLSKGVQVGFGANNCGGGCSCQTFDIRGWCNFSGDFTLGCVDFGFNPQGYEIGNNCNLINGDFEDGSSRWYINNPSTTTITGDAYSGSNAILITGDYETATYEMASAVPGTAYLLSGYGKLIGSPGWTALMLRFYDKDQNEIYKQGIQLSSTSWQLLNGGAIAPSGTYYIGIELYKGTGGSAVFDEICLEIIPEYTPGSCSGITNADFESPIGTEWSPYGSVTRTTDAAEGTYAALIGGGVNGGISTSTAGTGGTIYSLSFYAKQTGSINWAGLGLEFYDASWNHLSSSANDAFGSSYEQRNITAIAPPGTAHVNFWASKDGSGDVYLDGICLKGLSVSEVCDDGIDNDGDGLVDCEDSDCITGSNCTEPCIGNNMGFENGLTDWTTGGTPTISTDAYVGSNSVLLDWDAEQVVQNFNVDGDSLYQFSFWAKGTAGSSDWVGAVLKFYDGSGGYIGQLESKTPTNSDWTRFFILAPVPSNAVTMEMQLVVWGTSSNMRFDEICFQKSKYTIPEPSCHGCEIYPTSQGASSFWYNDGTGWIVHDVGEGGALCDNGDGTKTIRATLINGAFETAQPCGDVDGWTLEVDLDNKLTWAEWGGNYDDFGIVNLGCTDYHTEWDYWDITGGTLTGLGCNTGKSYNIIGNVPGYKFQVGRGANRGTCDFGMAGWVQYNLNGQTKTIDIYFEINEDCGKTEVCDDGIDNDGDGLTDGKDPDCAGTCYVDCENPYTFSWYDGSAGSQWEITNGEGNLTRVYTISGAAGDYDISVTLDNSDGQNIDFSNCGTAGNHFYTATCNDPNGTADCDNDSGTTDGQFTYDCDYLTFGITSDNSNQETSITYSFEYPTQVCNLLIGDIDYQGSGYADLESWQDEIDIVADSAGIPVAINAVVGSAVNITGNNTPVLNLLSDYDNSTGGNLDQNDAAGHASITTLDKVTSITFTYSNGPDDDGQSDDHAIRLSGFNFCPDYQEICDNGIDDDGDGLTDCADPDCKAPSNGSAAATDPYNCPDLNNGQIVITATGENLEYSIDNGTTYQASNTFSNLSAGTYIIRVRNSVTGCSIIISDGSKPTFTLTDPVCGEICDNGIDDDGDNLTDCADPDCGSLTISNVVVSNCIDQPLEDVATVDITVTWTNAPAHDSVYVTIDGKTEYIDIPNVTSPHTFQVMTAADGSSNIAVNAGWKNNPDYCTDDTTFNAPASCSNDEIVCRVLYLCGSNKQQDADPWDHGMVEYIDKINGSATLTPVLTKNDQSGIGMYDPSSPSTPLTVNFSDYELIVISPSVGPYHTATLVDSLKEFPGGILNMERRISDNLGMSTGDGWTNNNITAYKDNTNQITIYNYDNPNPIWDPFRTIYNYVAGGDVFLWADAWNMSSGINGIFMYYDESDGLTGISNHGDRVQLGYHMDGFYYNSDNGGISTSADWFDPIKHLTLDGKLYLDSAIVLAASNCAGAPEICDDGIDNDGDGNIDCADADCQGVLAVSAMTPGGGCAGGGGQIDLLTTGTAPFSYVWNDMTPSAQWTFENNTDDISGNGNNQNGGATATIGYSTDAVEGNYALEFDGDDYVRYSVDGSFMEVSFSELSFTAWLKPTDLSGVKMIFDEGGGTNGVGFRLNGATLEAGIRNGGGGSQTNAGTLAFPNDGEWHHVAMVFDNGDFRIYIDGVGGTIATAGFSTVNGHSGNGGIGQQDGGSGIGSGSGNNYSGLMDDVRLVHGTAWNANQIADMARNDGDRFHLENGNYTVTVSNGASCLNSETENVSISSGANVTAGGTIAANQTICSGDTPAAFTGQTDASGGLGGTIEYEWESSTDSIVWSVIGGSGFSTYTSGVLTQTTYFRRGARRTSCPTKIYSNVITVTVVDNFTTPGTISGDESQCGSYDPNEIASVTNATGGLGGSTEYQWQINEDGSTWVDVSGAIASTFDPPTITQTTQYRRGARRSPCSGWVYSNIVTKTVIRNFTNGGSIGSDQVQCGGYDPDLIVEVTAPSGGLGGTTEYQWEQNVNGAGWTFISGQTGNTYDPPAITETTQYRRGAKKSLCSAYIYSNTVTKSVVSSPTANIQTFPTSPTGNLCEGVGYVFAAEDAGAGITYSWNFGAYATPATATGIGPHTVVFDVPNGDFSTNFSVSLTTQLGSCSDGDMKNFDVRPPVNITDIDTDDPTACGASDGSIEVTVDSPSGANYQVSIDGGSTWGVVNQNTFNSLPAGTYNVRVRYQNTDCVLDYGAVILSDPFLSESGILANYDQECLSETLTFSALYSLFISQYTWDFGADATPATATGIGPHDVTYSSTGNKVVTLTISGFGCSKDYTDAFTVTENYSSGGTIVADQDLCGSFDPAELTELAAPMGGSGGTTEYQWEQRIEDGLGGWAEWMDISGATSVTYDPMTISAPVQIRRKARRLPCTDWLPSNEVTLTPAGEPTANPISFSTVCPGQPYGDDLTTNDMNLVQPSFSIYTQPANGTLSIFSDGQFLYNPNSTFCGQDEFVYEVCNFGGTCCDTALVRLNLNDNTAPTLFNIPADITIHCDEQVPLPPSVVAIENCLSVSLGLDEISTQGVDNCSLYDYQITRIWTATDYCGNGASDSQIITVEDKTAPDIYRIYTLPNGKKMVAGVMENVAERWKYIRLPISFPTVPVIFTQLASETDASLASVQLRNISTSQFEMRLNEEEAGDGMRGRDMVAWIAVEAGEQGADFPFEVGSLSLSSVSQNLAFAQNYGSDPGFISSPQSALELDPVGVRLSNLTGTSVDLLLQEESSADGETDHSSENFGYMVFEQYGDFTLSSGEVVGETGKVFATDAWTTVSLSNTYKNPVVIANTPANSDTDPALVRVKDVTTTEFKIRLSEWDYQDGSHAIENVSYFVVEGSVPFDITTACDNIPAALELNTEIIAVDNCDLALALEYTESPNASNCAPNNVVTRTWSAADECGNAVSYSRAITVFDTVPPTFTVPVDVYVSCSDDIDDLSLTGDVTDEADNCRISLNAIYTDVFSGTLDCNAGYTVQRNWSLSDGCDNVTEKTQLIFVQNAGIQVRLKMMLQGAIFNTVSGDTLMRDDLRALGLIPEEEPYTTLGGYIHVNGGGGETALPGVLDVTGKDAVVDWVFVEIRHPDVLDSVLATRSALVQRDGDVVDVDGISPVNFVNISPGSYNISLRHRNHLGTMTGQAKLLSDDPIASFTDFTSHRDSVISKIDARYDCKDFDGDGKLVICHEGTTSEIAAATWAVHAGHDDHCGPCGDYISVADGDWSSPGTWKDGNVPSTSVSGGQEVVINHDLTSGVPVQVDGGAMLWIENGTLDVTGSNDLTIHDGDLQMRGSALSVSGDLNIDQESGKAEIIGSNVDVSGHIMVTDGLAHFERVCVNVQGDFEFRDAEGHFIESCIDLIVGDFKTVSVDTNSIITNSGSKFHLMTGNFDIDGAIYGDIDAIWLESGSLINNDSDDKMVIDTTGGTETPFLCQDYDGDGLILICHSGGTDNSVSINSWPTHESHGDFCGPCGDYKTIADGDWNDDSIWEGGLAPNANLGGGEEIIINHKVTVNTDVRIRNSSVIWIENGTLKFTAFKNLYVEDGELYMRGSDLEDASSVYLSDMKSKVEVVNSFFDVEYWVVMDDGDMYFENSNITIGSTITPKGGDASFVNTCLNINWGYFKNEGANVYFSGSSCQITYGNFINEDNLSGDMSALWLKGGDLMNSGTWTADLGTYCINGSIGISPVHLPATEECVNISSVTDICTNVGDGRSQITVDTTQGDTLYSWLAAVGNYCVSGTVTGVDTLYLPASEVCGGISSLIDNCNCLTIIEDSEPVYRDSTLTTTAVKPYGNHALRSTAFGFVNWGGDFNQDRNSISQGPSNDITRLFLNVLKDEENIHSYPNFIRIGYDAADYDLDGRVIYQGPGNDRAKLLFDVIIKHPGNSSLLPNFIVPEQLPENGQ